MTRRRRLIVAAALAVVAVSGIVVAIALGGKGPPPALRTGGPVAKFMAPRPGVPAERRAESPVSQDHTPAPITVAAVRVPETLSDPLIEEEVAEFEEPGAVFYVSRIREAIVERNPRFARELLRQMKEEHSGSGLMAEAESLLEEARRKGGR